MHVVVKLFGQLRETAGAKEWGVILAEEARVRDLRGLLAQQHPEVEALGARLAISVNLEIAPDDQALREGDEVALLPPVSGGADESVCSLSDRPLDVGAVVQRVAGPDAGGLVTFVGAVRDASRGKDIRHLEYEAYPEMALREMEKIVNDARERWPGTRVAVAHRTGHLEVGELAVVVAAAAPHRGEAFDACRFTIDTLKERVPIWKKEVATDGEYWVDDHA